MKVWKDFIVEKHLLKTLEALNLVEKIENYTNNVGYSENWCCWLNQDYLYNGLLRWMNYLKIHDKIVARKFVPNRFKKIFVNWMTDTSRLVYQSPIMVGTSYSCLV